MMGRASLGLLAVVTACAGAGDEPELGVVSSELDITKFVLPPAGAAERAEIVRRFDHLDPGNTVPRGLLEDAVAYFDVNAPLIPKQDFLVVIDFSLYSGKDRYWLVDLATGAVEPHKVAHGSGSDPDNDGKANTFGNVPSSNKTSLGFYLTGEIYDGTHRHSMRLDGLSPDGSPNGMANTNARSRLIVMHEASYVDDKRTTQQGRSNGCPALDPRIEVAMVDRIHGGSLIYAATRPLHAPVGRAACGDGTCDGSETADSCPADCATDPVDPPADDPGMLEDEPPAGGGCAATGGAGWLAGLALVTAGAARRRRSGGRRPSRG
ncbi:MAG: murein L,D-transpeptidase catalytic domain family protein [Deltaproteobacteria bacterium]|nr:murein L,D-transpeptidase catalytic domain family protein [Deltaproteobacteria bacterium]